MNLNDAVQYHRQNREAQLDELIDLVKIPSISAQPSHAGDIREAAQWLRNWITGEGGAAELLETNGHPLVWGEIPTANTDVPTVLVYGHYDVQPVDPLDLWQTDPFQPEVRDGRLYARGASDMKGQVMAALCAIRSLRSTGDLPLNIRFLFEGEEEIGSPSLAAALERYGERFRADVCLNPDTGMISETTPSIRYGLRGLAYYELHIHGPAKDLHSGHYGGVVHNPAQVLAEIIAGLHDQDGTVTLPGFYDRVRAIDAVEHERLARVPFTEADALSETGVHKLWGEPGFTVTERVTARPTLEVNGMLSGYTDPGAKTVIASHAMAKISTRLVPDQRPEEVTRLFREFLEANVPDTVSWELVEMAGGDPFICDPTSPAHERLSNALKAVWGTEPVLSRSGGSVPVTADLERTLGIPSVLTGFALPEDNVHSPNESQHLETWYRGTEALIRFFASW